MQNTQTTYGVFVLFQVVVHKKVRKWWFFTTFFILTFELDENIRKQKNPCPGGQVLKLWLCYLCNSRADLVEIGQEIEEMKKAILKTDYF